MRKFIGFASVGTVGFGVDAGILYVLLPYLGPYLARLCSFFGAVLVTWRLNRLFTFKSQHDGWSEFKRYFASQSVGAGLNYAVYALAIFTSGWMEKFPLVALGLGSIAGLGINFILAKKYVFKVAAKNDGNSMTGLVSNREYGANRMVALLFSLISAGTISLLLGQDANWDLKNYHIHNAWALLNNRMENDLFPAGIQSYFNPLLDLPYYLLAIEWLPHYPRVVAFLMGLPAGFLLFFVWLCVEEILRAFKVEQRFIFIMSLVSVAIGMTGAATISQWGTTFNEIQVATCVVAGIYLIIANIGPNGLSPKWFIVAGICLGIGAGLKLTAAIYAPGAFLAILLISRQLKYGVYRAIVFSIGWWGGFLVFYGWWGYRLYQLTGSPMFPMFNSLFHSPLIGAGSGMDNRFKPTGLAETLFYPFHWLLPEAMVVVEPSFADPRFAVGYLAILLMAVAFVYYCINSRSRLAGAFNGEVMPRQALTLILWLVVSYLLWQVTFSILRYAVPIEVFTGLVILMAIITITRITVGQKHSVLMLSLVTVIGLFCASFTKYPEFGRAGYKNSVIDVENVPLPNNSLVLFTGPPIAYLALFLSGGSSNLSFIGIVNEFLNSRDYPLWEKVNQQIKAHSGEMFMVERPEQKPMRIHLSELGLSIDQASCRDYKSSIDQPFTVCALLKDSK